MRTFQEYCRYFRERGPSGRSLYTAIDLVVDTSLRLLEHYVQAMQEGNDGDESASLALYLA